MLRHGKCEGGDIFRGTTDVALLPEGFEEMHFVEKSAQKKWGIVISSPLKRCRIFSEHISKCKDIPIILDSRLREMSFGDWEGREIEDVWKNDYKRVAAWSQNPESNRPPGGESLEEVIARVGHFYDQAITKHKGKNILLVTHGGIIRVLLSRILNMPAASVNKLDVPYASISRFAVYHSERGDITKLLAHNFVNLR